MANLITTARFLLLYLLVWMAYRAPPAWQLLDAPLVVVIFVLDGIDGYVARRRGESSLFGSVFDIAVDRVVENVLWLVLGDLGLVPIWIAILFVTRGFLVDSIRSRGAARGETPFGMMRSPLGRFLVAGHFMRGTYGVVKATAFAWLLMIQPWPMLFPALWAQWSGVLQGIGHGLAYLAVLFSLARGLPVMAEFALRNGRPRRTPGARGTR
ncbi:CDP-alcohol phosphatidyltransferase [bacterium BMS3Bbin12]|nr:CDP-alcohol phosphatidyltransferase [bacterium BMS3Abin12]GBE47879.1 CDP-alcohol phosphatidyltransferase [bacterium BMS3Bbin12]GBE50357.1 CDP-alcohol phosphatidyltransferase [bacterium BMS3Bbin13]